MFSALWGSAILLVLSFQLGFVTAGRMVFAVSFVFAVCHSWSTTFMVIGSSLLRDERRRNRVKFTYVPIALVSGSLLLGLLVSRIGVLPTTSELTARHWLWALYLGLFWVGHFWHFGNQDFGVLSIYRVKAGQVDPRERRVDKGYAVAMMLVIQPFVYLSVLSKSALSEAFFSYVPVSRAFVALGAEASIVGASALTAAIVVFELKKSNTSFPKLLYYAVMFAHPMFLYFAKFQLGAFYMIAYFWSHWFVAIGLVGRINTNHHRDRGLGRYRSVLRHILTLGLIAGSFSVLHLYFRHFNLFSENDYKETLASITPEYATLIGLALGFFLAEQLVHYYCDRCLFRFRDPGVRKAVAPLL